jgi:UDPglucose 6-dehydrogenase
VKALQHTAESAGHPLQLLAAVDAANDLQKHVLPKKIQHHFGQDLKGRTFALWGLAFKPNTDDMREAPSLTVIADLVAAGASIRAYDPVARTEARHLLAKYPNVQVVDQAMATLEGADALVILTEWQEFRSPDFEAIRHALKTPVIFDGRNLYEPAAVAAHGITYHAIGRPVVAIKA